MEERELFELGDLARRYHVSMNRLQVRGDSGHGIRRVKRENGNYAYIVEDAAALAAYLALPTPFSMRLWEECPLCGCTICREDGICPHCAESPERAAAIRKNRPFLGLGGPGSDPDWSGDPEKEDQFSPANITSQGGHDLEN